MDGTSLGSTTRRLRDGREVVVADRPDAGRVEATVDGVTAAFVEYHRPGARPDHVVAVHTSTEPAWGGLGVGSALVAGLLDLVRAAGLRLVPRCPFVGDHLSRHPEQADLVDASDRHLVRHRDA